MLYGGWSAATWLMGIVFAVVSVLLLDCATELFVTFPATHFAHASSRRFAADTPPPYPDGWYNLCYTWELEGAGGVKSVRALGREFVVWRSKASGKVHVWDAYCPHLGANLCVAERPVPRAS